MFLKFIMPVFYSFMHYVTGEIMLQRKLLFTQKDLIRQDGFHYKNTCPNTHPINQRKNYLSKLSLYSEPCSRLLGTLMRLFQENERIVNQIFIS